MSLDRRRFIHVSALSAIGAVAMSACDRTPDSSLDRPALLGMLGPERVHQLGTDYRAATAGENNATTLRAALSRARSRSWWQRVMHGSVDDQVRDDFANGRTVLVDGWVLSLTEARQAALFSLTPV